MRHIYQDLIPEFRSQFNPPGLSPSDLETILAVELMISGCLTIDPDMPYREAWSVLTGYDDIVIPTVNHREILYRLRILFRDVHGSYTWNELLDHYLALDTAYRLYTEQEHGRLQRQTPQLFSDRVDWYVGILGNPIGRRKRVVSMAGTGVFKYWRWDVDGNRHEFEGEIGHAPEQTLVIPEYRDKLTLRPLIISGHGSLSSSEVAATLNPSGGKPNLRLRSLSNPPEQAFTYAGTLHVVGGLGAGKTTFRIRETVRLVKEEGAHVGFIENSVSQVLERVQELKNHGIHAVPIIGKSTRKVHQAQYLASHRRGVSDVTDWAEQGNDGLKYLSDVCVIQALADDEDTTNSFPCTKLYQNGKTGCYCPFASSCGVFKDIADLKNADVWVTTSASVLRTHLPTALDPLERSVYEAMYDLLDVIFIDEVDEVQKQFDASFITELQLFGRTGSFFERVYQETMQKTMGKYDLYAGDPIVYGWKRYLTALERVITGGIFELLSQSPQLLQRVRRSLLRISTLAYHVGQALSDEAESADAIERILTTYAGDPFEHELGQQVDDLLQQHTRAYRQQVINGIIDSLSGHFQPRADEDNWIENIEFFLYLARADYCVKRIIELYPLVKSKLGLVAEVDGHYSVDAELGPFMKSAMTGLLTGYRFDVKDGERMGEFKFVQYRGVGRALLHEWNQLFQDSDGKQGPAVVCLSGTSLAPGSAHYHLTVKPSWLMERNHVEPTIEQHFWPVVDGLESQRVFVSGARGDGHRTKQIERMVRNLLPKIDAELEEWARKGGRRRVLLIVNSYDDVDDVGAIVRQSEHWRRRVRLLKRQANEDDAIARAELESFSDYAASVLVAPLMSISRGYNILDENYESLFGSVFFIVRPYPVPNDITYLIQMLHTQLPTYLSQIGDSGDRYSAAIKSLRAMSNKFIHAKYSSPAYWAMLDERERETIAWYTFVPIWQTIGRMIRNGSSARVFYCDAKFMGQPRNREKGESLIEYWQRIMAKNQRNPAFISLYGPFIDSIQRVGDGEIDD